MARTRTVDIARNDGSVMRSFHALPEGEGSGPWPGVLVIHEAFGLNRDISDKTARLADMGYSALAVDLLDRPGPKALCIMRTMRTLNKGTGDAFDDIEAARRWLTEDGDTDGSRLGIIGFCMGGGFALLVAARSPMNAAATFYGAVPKEAEELRDVCPVVGGYGGRDRIFAKQGKRLERHLTELGIEHDLKTYPNAGHSYMSDHKGIIAKLNSFGPMRLGFREEEAEDSWRRVEAFFGRHLAK